MVSKIPVLETEKLTIKKAGRGLRYNWDEANYFSGNIVSVSGGATGSHRVLPAASTMGWATLDIVSGSTTFSGYIPVFKVKW